MNEPHIQTAQQWYNGALPAIRTLRKSGANQTILIPGTDYTGAHSWISSGNGNVWKNFNEDPQNNFVFEMHQYLDEDSSGTHNTCIRNSYQALQSANDWLNQYHLKGFLAEFGWSPDSNCMNKGQQFLDFLSNNSNVWIGWTWWCGGIWYPQNCMFLLDPFNSTSFQNI